MATKSKKLKLIISFLSFFLGMNLLIAVILTGIYFKGHYNGQDRIFFNGYGMQPADLLRSDYQETSAFAGFISLRLQFFIDMATGEEPGKHLNSYYGYSPNILTEVRFTEAVDYDTFNADDAPIDDKDYEPYDDAPAPMADAKAMADALHESIHHDKNLIYSIAYQGDVLYSNDEEFAWTVSDFSSLPSEYNFWLYFDGTQVSVFKDGEAYDIYGDGYYRDNSPWYVPGYKNIPVDEQLSGVSIYMAAARSPVPYAYATYGTGAYKTRSDGLYTVYLLCERWKFSLRLAAALILLMIILLLASAVLAKSRQEFLTLLAAGSRKIFLELRILLFGIILVGMYGCLCIFFGDLLDMTYYVYNIFSGCIVFFWGSYFAVNELLRNRPLLKQSLAYRLFHHLTHTIPERIRDMKLPYARRMTLRFLPLLVLWGSGILFAFFLFLTLIADSFRGGGELFIVALLLLLLVAAVSYPVLSLYRKNMQLAKDLDLMAEKITAIHRGDYANSCEIAGSSELSPLAEQLDDIRNGMSAAVEERLKSERLKIELITNVSHDLKTPLTSIISYVELLKQENDLPEHVQDYVKILDDKTARLNQMIQDVFAVSKAASGELPINLEKLDFAKLLRQTLADMGEQIEASSFSVKTSIPNEAVLIEADGQRLYRVFQNLIQNALKYSLEGSRIYITLSVDDNTACASVKNTSAQEIDSNTDYSERFLRGDASRSDGGSGLGLSIAKTFTESCGGRFQLETNADLFTVTVSFQTV